MEIEKNMGRESPEYCKQRYWALRDSVIKNMSPWQAAIIRALRRDHWTWNGIMGVAIEDLKWDVDKTQMAGEQLCMLAAEILGHKSMDFEDTPIGERNAKNKRGD